jgi:hypothetical protein
MPGPLTVQCSSDLGALGSCGTPVSTGCSDSQCWAYRPTFSSRNRDGVPVSFVVTLHLLRGIPAGVFAAKRLSLVL